MLIKYKYLSRFRHSGKCFCVKYQNSLQTNEFDNFLTVYAINYFPSLQVFLDFFRFFSFLLLTNDLECGIICEYEKVPNKCAVSSAG